MQAFQETVERALIEAVSDDGGLDYKNLAQRITNLAEAYYEQPSGLVQLNGSLEKYTVQGQKELTLQVEISNNAANLVALARIGTPAGIAIRAVQADIEAMAEANTP